MSVTKFEKPMGTEITTLSEQIGTLNSKMVWKPLGNTTGQVAVSLSGITFNELLCVDTVDNIVVIIPAVLLSGNAKNFDGAIFDGISGEQHVNKYVRFEATTSSVTLAYKPGETSTTTCSFYYR